MIDGWTRTKVKDICILGRGRVISEDEIRRKPGSFPVYSSQTANDGEMGRINTFDFDGEYVTWTTDGANAGTVFYRNGKFNCTNVCGTLKARREDTLSLRFLAYKLSTVSKRFVSYIGNPKLMNGVMAEIEIDIPRNRSEQSAIARILSTVDKAIEKTEQLIAKYERIKTGLMQDLLTKGIDEQGRIRSESTHRFKDSPLGRIPVEWEVGTMADIAIIDPVTSISHLNRNSIVSFIAMEDVSNDAQIVNKRSRRFGEVMNGYTLFTDGDILFAKITPCTENGKGGLVLDLANGVGFGSTEFIVLRPADIESTYFIYHLSISKQFRKAAATRMTGSAGQQRVPKSFFSEYLIPIPPKAERQRIGSLMEKMSRLIKQCKKQDGKLNSLKMGILQDLLSGRVRVPEEMIEQMQKETEMAPR